MAWSTVVKMTNRLIDTGLIARAGTADRNEHKGKNALVFDLLPTNPLAIGMDIEYSKTSIILTNLKGEELFSDTLPTPIKPDTEELLQFTLHTISNFLRKAGHQGKLQGVGIGMPGVGFPVTDEGAEFDMQGFAKTLSDNLDLPVICENSSRTYAHFEKWFCHRFPEEDFILISVRTGLGTGIFMGGELLQGSQGMAGEIGHISIAENGKECRCGKKGCLETVVNDDILFKTYSGYTKNSGDKRTVLDQLFLDAGNGRNKALDIIREFASNLALGITPLVMTLNIEKVVINGYFGDFGGVFVPFLDRELRRHLMPKIKVSVSYTPFDNQGHTHGAAMLFLEKYLTL